MGLFVSPWMSVKEILFLFFLNPRFGIDIVLQTKLALEMFIALQRFKICTRDTSESMQRFVTQSHLFLWTHLNFRH